MNRNTKETAKETATFESVDEAMAYADAKEGETTWPQKFKNGGVKVCLGGGAVAAGYVVVKGAVKAYQYATGK